MVVGYNSAGTDAISFVTWVELANGASITITDADYLGGGNSSGQGTGGGTYQTTNGSIPTIVWTNNTGSPVNPGTVIVVETSSPSANIGSATGVGFGLTNQGEHVFLAEGSFNGSGNLIGNLLFGLDYDGTGTWEEAGESKLPSALNVADGNLSFTHEDSKEYNGARSGLALADYPAEVINTANWGIPTGGGTLSAVAFVNNVVPPTPPTTIVKALGQVSDGLLFHSRRMNNKLPILDETWSLAQGAGSNNSDNLNGPSCVRLPSWLPANQRAHPTAEYYLYFADHSGDYIRMAWAANLEGPWTGYRMNESVHTSIGDRGVLSLGADERIDAGDGVIVHDHIASPQVFIEGDSAANGRFVMYYHGRIGFGSLANNDPQRTAAATSSDGLNFNMPSGGDSRAGQSGHGTLPVSYGESYFRVFEEAGRSYALSNTGDLNAAPATGNPLIPDASYNHASNYWERGPKPFTTETESRGWIDWGDGYGPLRPRHFGVLKRDGFLYAFFTNKSGSPERIKISTFDFGDLAANTSPDNDEWKSWKGDFPNQELIRPEEAWEGGLLPFDISEAGSSNTPSHQLRDPAILQDSDGRTYLFYSGSGERAIGLAQLVSSPVVSGPTEVTTGSSQTWMIATDIDVAPSMLKISRTSEVEIDYDAEELVSPFNYSGNGFNPVQSATVGQGSNSYQLAHNATQQSVTLTFPQRYYAHVGASLQFSSRLGSSSTGQIAEVQVSFDGAVWQTLWIRRGGSAQGAFSTVSVDIAGLAGRTFDLRFRYLHEPLRNTSIVSGNSAGTGWFIDSIVAEGLESVTPVSEAPFTAASFSLSEIDSLINPFIVTGDGEDDNFLLSVEGLHSGTGFSELVEYGKPFVIRVRSSYEQFQYDYFTEAEQADPLISADGADPDIDGLTNVEEHVFGTNPTLSDRGLFTITGNRVGGTVEPTLSFPWNPEANYTYQLQMSTDLKKFDDILFTESSMVNGNLLDVTVEPAPSVPDPGDNAFFRLKILSK